MEEAINELFDLNQFESYMRITTNKTVIVGEECTKHIYKLEDVELFTIHQQTLYTSNCIVNQWVEFTDFGKQYLKEELINFINKKQ